MHNYSNPHNLAIGNAFNCCDLQPVERAGVCTLPCDNYFVFCLQSVNDLPNDCSYDLVSEADIFSGSVVIFDPLVTLSTAGNNWAEVGSPYCTLIVHFFMSRQICN